MGRNEIDYFRVRLRGCPLLTLDNPPKILRDDAKEDSSTSKPSKDFDKKGLLNNDWRGWRNDTLETTSI